MSQDLARLRLRLTRYAMIGIQPNAELSSYPKPNTRLIFLFAPVVRDKALHAIRRIIGDDLYLP